MSPSPIPLLIHLIHLQNMYVKYMRLKILFLVCRSGTPASSCQAIWPPLQMLKYERFYAINFGKNMNEKKRLIGMVSPWRGENDEWK